MKVEVLMASYNGERYIEEQIHSIMEQSHHPLHLLIRDDGSTDGTVAEIKKAIQKYPERITLLETSKRLGPIGNFSELLQASQASYVMFADQDDMWFPDKVEKTYLKMQELENEHTPSCPLLIHTDLKVVSHDKKIIHPSYWKYSRLFPKRSHRLSRLLVQNVITGCTVMLNRQLVKIASPIPAETVMHDWWIGLVAAAFGLIEALPEPTLLYRQHGNNTLGAKQFGSKEHLLAGYKKLKQADPKKSKQAKIFYDRYKCHLNYQQRHLLETYFELGKMSFLKSRYLFLKHRFFKQGLLRNMGTFLLQRQP